MINTYQIGPLLLFLVLLFNVNSQSTTLEISAFILTPNQTDESEQFYADDFSIKPSGLQQLFQIESNGQKNENRQLPDFSELISTHSFSYRNFPITKEFEIVNVTAMDSLNNGFDFYIHFNKLNEEWKITRIARLDRSAVAELWIATLTDQEVDSIIQSDNPYKIIQSREQFDFIKQLYSLTLAYDDTIVHYFQQNADAFYQLKKEYQTFTEIKGKNVLVKNGPLQSLNKEGLLISEIHEFDKANNDLIGFFIRRSSHGSVGFMFIKNSDLIPQILIKGRIYFLREIVDGWYLFKGN